MRGPGDPAALTRGTADHLPPIAGVLAALLAGKAAAAELVSRLFGCPPAERLTMWSLTLPQVAGDTCRHLGRSRHAQRGRGAPAG